MEKAIPLYIQSSRTGYSKAAYQLGKLYSEQDNDRKAIYWYKKAYIGGKEKAAYKLGRLFVNEIDNPEGKTFALAWFYIGIKSGDENAKQAADSLEGILTSDLIEKAAGYAVSPQFVAE